MQFKSLSAINSGLLPLIDKYQIRMTNSLLLMILKRQKMGFIGQQVSKVFVYYRQYYITI
jgi:hypothetical protein